jgi:hypothetical protein
MGLDIYLYTADQGVKNRIYNDASEALYTEGADGKSPRDRMTEDEYKAWGEQFSYTSYDDVPSNAYPDHLFNRRYLRSSYNSDGFNHVVPAMLATSGKATYPEACGSLYWIFEPMGREWDGDDGNLSEADLPLLAECRMRAESVVDALRSSDRLQTITVSQNMFLPPMTTTEHQALAMYREQVATDHVKDGEWWSNRDMEVFGEGVTILAAVPGQATFGVPAVHLVYRMSDDGFDSYMQSAEIVVEFIDEATELVRRDGGARISWSG